MSTKSERRAQDQLRQDWRELLQDARFRRVVWQVLEVTGIYSAAFTGNSQDMRRLGERNVGLQIIAMMQFARPTSYAELLLEAAKSQEQETLQNEHRSSDDG